MQTDFPTEREGRREGGGRKGRREGERKPHLSIFLFPSPEAEAPLKLPYIIPRLVCPLMVKRMQPWTVYTSLCVFKPYRSATKQIYSFTAYFPCNTMLLRFINIDTFRFSPSIWLYCTNIDPKLLLSLFLRSKLLRAHCHSGPGPSLLLVLLPHTVASQLLIQQHPHN